MLVCISMFMNKEVMLDLDQQKAAFCEKSFQECWNNRFSVLICVFSPRLLYNLLTGAKTRYSVCRLHHSKILEIFNKNVKRFYSPGTDRIIKSGHYIPDAM